MKSLAFVLSLSLIILLACVASERTTSDTPTVTRVDTATTATVTDTDTTTSEPSMLPITPEPLDWRSDTPGAFAIDAEVERHEAKVSAKARPLSLAAVQPPPPSAPQSRSTRTVTLLGQTQAETLIASPGHSALPVPILDHRTRSCVVIPIVTNPRTHRMNLQFTPNLRDVVAKRWNDSTWRKSVRIEKNTETGHDEFPVPLWRQREDVVTFWKFIWVQAGPELPHGSPQYQLDPEFWRGNDKLLIEATEDGPLLIAYIMDDRWRRWIVEPRLSIVYSSGDPNAPHGTWTTIRRFDYMTSLDSAPDESRLAAGDEVYHCPALEANGQRMPESWIVWSPMVGGQKPTTSGCELVKVIQ